MDTAHDFTARLQRLLRREHDAMADFLVQLAEFDRRRLWLDVGYASLFDFLTRELGLSKASASFRKRAAELIQRFPEIVEPFREGRLCLSSVFEVAKVLTPENRTEVLPRFFQLGKREAKVLAAALRPDDAPVLREVVTPVKLPAPTAKPPDAIPTGGAAAEHSSLAVVCPAKPTRTDARSTPQKAPGSAPPAEAPATTAEPLTAELSRLHVTVSRRLLEKLEAARAALSHSHPAASADEILEAGLDLLLERHARRKGLVKNPRREPPPAKPDHVPAHVKRAVWERDGGRCQWRLASGGICGETHRVELDHVNPRARGGPPKIDNLRLLCRRHNDFAAREVYGDAWMDRFTRRARKAAGQGASPARGEPASVSSSGGHGPA